MLESIYVFVAMGLIILLAVLTVVLKVLIMIFKNIYFVKVTLYGPYKYNIKDLQFKERSFYILSIVLFFMNIFMILLFWSKKYSFFGNFVSVKKLF